MNAQEMDDFLVDAEKLYWRIFCRLFGHGYKLPFTQAPFPFAYLKDTEFEMICKRCGDIKKFNLIDDFKWYGGYARP